MIEQAPLPLPREGTVFIYALLEPDSGAVRYIGKTVNPAVRLYGHLKHAGGGRYRKNKWVQALLDCGLSPRMTILEAALEPEARDCEKRWVLRHEREGAELLNGVEKGKRRRGGRGMSAYYETNADQTVVVIDMQSTGYPDFGPCYECRDGLHDQCVGAPCSCPSKTHRGASSVVRDVRRCVACHEPGARLVGNVQAGEILEACAVFEELLGAAKRARTSLRTMPGADRGTIEKLRAAIAKAEEGESHEP